ncbi:glucose/arabinose dehydrogenase [Mycolicibacterium sp. BK634]|uniref:PQQ-dependent sugar dehydrogenase n=1 Tax=Mycobacteriaceae TaxID=1762 RepID=UPI00105B7A2A|nr:MULTISPECIES: PQQ-dependent sugar dehydrogenase [Mycobacteriaceae]MBB3748544.1 glucose/arabinose dehydrogenase [Mycolicibacterium sp. BK634]TDO10341.1 glucose/arabinose dehydrogenase [Mycobacterium sp. BK086]
MPGWRAKAACIGVAVVTAACGHPAPPAPPASAPTGLVPVTVAVPAGLGDAPLDISRQALVPAGWSMAVWARVPRARLAAWAPDGTLLVSVPASGQVLRLTPGQQVQTSVLLDGLDQPHGLTFGGDKLYVAESDQVDEFDYRNGQATGRRVMSDGLPDARSPDLGGAYAHALKSVAVGPEGAVYFSIGSTGNVTSADRDATPPRATVMRIPPGGGPAAVFATGVRNGTGLAVAPDGSIWTAVNNRDQIADPRPGASYGKVTDYVNDHPSEAIARLTPGRELGWPYCHPDTDGQPVFLRDVQTNADGGRLDCAALSPVEQTLGAHSAPLGLSFEDGALPAPYTSGALVGVHGSWNRTPPRAPEVSFFAWHSGTLGPQQTLVGGFQANDGSRWGRPVAAVVGPDGAVYITDDYAGAVYRLAPPGR